MIDLELLAYLVSHIIAIVSFLYIARGLVRYNKEVNELRSRVNNLKFAVIERKNEIDTLQIKFDDLETIVNANTYYICDVLRKEENKENG